MNGVIDAAAAIGQHKVGRGQEVLLVLPGRSMPKASVSGIPFLLYAHMPKFTEILHSTSTTYENINATKLCCL